MVAVVGTLRVERVVWWWFFCCYPVKTKKHGGCLSCQWRAALRAGVASTIDNLGCRAAMNYGVLLWLLLSELSVKVEGQRQCIGKANIYAWVHNAVVAKMPAPICCAI
jgi:hypothetical protein